MKRESYKAPTSKLSSSIPSKIPIPTKSQHTSPISIPNVTPNIGSLRSSLSSMSFKSARSSSEFKRLSKEMNQLSVQSPIHLVGRSVSKKVLEPERRKVGFVEQQPVLSSRWSDFNKYLSLIPNKVQVFGLSNLGNTCFMNSTLQCLISNRLLMGYFISLSKNPLAKKTDLVKAFEELILNVTLKNAVFSPSLFRKAFIKKAPYFQGFEQQDAHEFLRLFLDFLHEDLLTRPSRPQSASASLNTRAERLLETWRHYEEKSKTIVSDIFMGMMESQVKCLSCGHISSMFEPFYELTVHLKMPTSKKASLMSCLQHAVQEEQLDGRLDCDGCKQKQPKTKRIAMAKIPDTLVIQLSRFDHQSSFNVRKDKTPVEFPQLLTDIDFLLSDVRLKYADEPEYFRYQLRSFCAHSGTLQFGHYVAYVKENDWTYRSDSEISSVSFGPVLEREDAYVLFYERIY